MWRAVSEAASIWAMPLSIGMFPDIPVEMYHYLGNTSLAGAYAMLYSTEAERKVYELAQNMTYIELSNMPTVYG